MTNTTSAPVHFEVLSVTVDQRGVFYGRSIGSGPVVGTSGHFVLVDFGDRVSEVFPCQLREMS